MNQANHAFKDFDQSLKQLERQFKAAIEKIVAMNDLCVQAVEKLTDKEALLNFLQQARGLDKEINKIEAENISAIQNIIGKYSPRGQDLRFIIGSVKLATLLESSADKLKNCIKRMVKMDALPGEEKTSQIRQMLEENGAVMAILPRLLEGFDDDLSSEMNRRRKQIEMLYREIWTRQSGDEVTYHNTVMLAKNIERIVDIASDLRKIIYFIHTGERLVKKKKQAAATE